MQLFTEYAAITIIVPIIAICLILAMSDWDEPPHLPDSSLDT